MAASRLVLRPQERYRIKSGAGPDGEREAGPRVELVVEAGYALDAIAGPRVRSCLLHQGSSPQKTRPDPQPVDLHLPEETAAANHARRSSPSCR